jgi:hypothetical protein
MPKIKVPDLYKKLQIESYISWEREVLFFIDVVQIVNPQSILEIGFYRGGSAFLWLYLTNASLLSVDPIYNISDREDTMNKDKAFAAIKDLRNEFGERFGFLQKDSANIAEDIKNLQFDLMFIDGGHQYNEVMIDFQTAITKNIPWVLVDDMNNEVMDAYEKYKFHFLPPVRIYNRDATFRDKPIQMYLLKRRTSLPRILELEE